MMTKLYAGVGSRKTPNSILETMSKISKFLNNKGYVLRSGGAVGADRAFEAGAGPLKEIFKESDIRGQKGAVAMHMAKEIHPNWNACSGYAKRLHARNVFQILGEDLETPVEFVLCWTQGGKKVGGTRTAIIIAEEHNIPVINLAKDGWREEIGKFF